MAKTLKSVIGPNVPSAMGFQAQTSITRLNGVESFFNNSTAQEAILGHRYEWGYYTITLTTTWVDLINLAGPGVIQLLALWMETGGSDADDTQFRIMFDGNVVFTQTIAWQSATDDGKGYIPIGSVLWDDTNFIPLYGGIGLEALPFNSSFQVQLSAAVADVTNNYKCCYRWYQI